MMKKKLTSTSLVGLIFEFFKKNSSRDIAHPEIVDWAVQEWKKRTGKVFRDPDRAIRTLHERGYLKKIKKGVYHYDSSRVNVKRLKAFSIDQKNKILKRDNYKCVICGRGKNEGMELHVDHIKPRYLGGKSRIENGQTLCSQHNFLKKNFKQTETGKKMFLRLYELSKKENNELLKSFCQDILKTYEKHDINGQIKWQQ